ncbi:hypothetical protein BB558_002453 [Smittium angustum]|uniref:Telomerase activating protein Est1-like N-terminal domain-containing protein n=1 Tax=Smittium angustum TaxID=133377 RepID=A0A2U1J8M9_SMIAN|nr:hypothetical protein BB558_002453 [Smittium angustum]
METNNNQQKDLVAQIEILVQKTVKTLKTEHGNTDYMQNWNSYLVQRSKLSEFYVENILQDPVLANKINIDEKLWRACCYEGIDICRENISNAKKLANPQSFGDKVNGRSIKQWFENLEQIINISASFFASFLLQLQDLLGDKSFEQMNYKLNIDGNIPKNKTVKFESVLKIASRINVYLGDIERYRDTYFLMKNSNYGGKWILSEYYYTESIKVWSWSGKGYSQLAIISHISGSIPSSMFWYALSISYNSHQNVKRNFTILCKQYIETLKLKDTRKKNTGLSKLGAADKALSIYMLYGIAQYYGINDEIIAYISKYVPEYLYSSRNMFDMEKGKPAEHFRSAALLIITLDTLYKQETETLGNINNIKSPKSTIEYILDTIIQHLGFLTNYLSTMVETLKDLEQMEFNDISLLSESICLYIDYFGFCTEKSSIMNVFGRREGKAIQSLVLLFNKISKLYKDSVLEGGEADLPESMFDNDGKSVMQHEFILRGNKTFAPIYEKMDFEKNCGLLETVNVLGCRMYKFLKNVNSGKITFDEDAKLISFGIVDDNDDEKKSKMQKSMAIMAESRLKEQVFKMQTLIEESNKLENQNKRCLLIPDETVWLYKLDNIIKLLESKRALVLISLDSISKLDLLKNDNEKESVLARTATRKIETLLEKRQRELPKNRKIEPIENVDIASVYSLNKGYGIITQLSNNFSKTFKRDKLIKHSSLISAALYFDEILKSHNFPIKIVLLSNNEQTIEICQQLNFECTTLDQLRYT